MFETLTQKLAGFLPQYGSILWSVLRSPVNWVSDRSRAETEAWPAITFWSASFALYLLTHFLMFGRTVEPFAYVISTLLANGLHLVLTALGFLLAWRIIGHRLGLPSVLTALAYCWGAVIPIQIVLIIVMFAALRVLSGEAYVIVANLLNGCGDVGATARLWDVLLPAAQSAGVPGLAALALYAVLFLALTAVSMAYGIAFLRVLRRLAPPTGGKRFLLACGTGLVLWAIAGSVSAVVDLMLLTDGTACLTPPDPVAVSSDQPAAGG